MFRLLVLTYPLLSCVKGILMANKPGICARKQISVHDVVHPYRFTRDMLAGMTVLRQLDDKFIVGVLSQESRFHWKSDAEKANVECVKEHLEWLSQIHLFALSLCISPYTVNRTRNYLSSVGFSRDVPLKYLIWVILAHFILCFRRKRNKEM